MGPPRLRLLDEQTLDRGSENGSAGQRPRFVPGALTGGRDSEFSSVRRSRLRRQRLADCGSGPSAPGCHLILYYPPEKASKDKESASSRGTFPWRDCIIGCLVARGISYIVQDADGSGFLRLKPSLPPNRSRQVGSSGPIGTTGIDWSAGAQLEVIP